MSTVKELLKKKNNTIHSVRTTDSVEKALELMRDNRVRSILVIDNMVLKGIITQGDCAIKVLLPFKNPKLTMIEKIMTPNPLSVTSSNTLDECMAIMVHKHIRHLPVLENNSVIGIVSIGDTVKSIMDLQDSQIKFLETFIKGHGG